jgi:hypothetical protein
MAKVPCKRENLCFRYYIYNSDLVRSNSARKSFIDASIYVNSLVYLKAEIKIEKLGCNTI